MIKKVIDFGEKYRNATLTTYIHEEASAPRPAIIICPGGAYMSVAEDREGSPIAEHYYNNGINAYVLDYSVKPYASNYLPLIQASLSVKYVRLHAAEHNTAPNKIITCGFSAGGHLAASVGILWNIPEVRAAVGVKDGECPEGINRPDGMILSYPVITALEFAHRGSIANLAGKDDYDEEDIKKFSLELNVDKTTPPMFIWHTVTDEGVPVQNSTLLINKYLEHKIPFEAHLYPYGRHGLSLANEKTDCGDPNSNDPHVATWADLSVMWINDTFNK